MIEPFQKIPVTLPKPVGYINKRRMLLTYIGGKCFTEKHKSENPPIKSPKLSKESQKKEDNIKKISSTLELLEITNPLE